MSFNRIEHWSIEREMLTQFIELYSHLPCLWDVNNEEYKDKNRKAEALEQLSAKLAEFDPEANVTKTKKKIENLRTAYYREVRKVKKSVMAGATGNDIHKPFLWYFNLFDSFMPKRESESRYCIERDRDSLGSDERPVIWDTASDDHRDKIKRHNAVEEISKLIGVSRKEVSTKWMSLRGQYQRERKRISSIQGSGADAAPACQWFAYNDIEVLMQSNVPQDSFSNDEESRNSERDRRRDYVPEPKKCKLQELLQTKTNSFAEYIGEELENVESFQRHVAEKLISEILYLARTGNLSNDSKIESNSVHSASYVHSVPESRHNLSDSQCFGTSSNSSPDPDVKPIAVFHTVEVPISTLSQSKIKEEPLS